MEQHNAVAEERTRIAENVHDLIVQQLYAAGLEIGRAAATTLPGEATDDLTSAVDNIEGAIRQLRSLIRDDDPPTHAGACGTR